jgi:hypothetical protein
MKVFLMLDISLFSIKESCIIILNRRLWLNWITFNLS